MTSELLRQPAKLGCPCLVHSRRPGMGSPQLHQQKATGCGNPGTGLPVRTQAALPSFGRKGEFFTVTLLPSP